MSIPVEQFKALLDENKINYAAKVDEETEIEYVSATFSCENTDVSWGFGFVGGECTFSCSICDVPAEKKADMLVCLNSLNNGCRTIKFFVNVYDEVTAVADALIDDVTGGEVCFELMVRSVQTIDEVYPSIMEVLQS